MTTLIEYLENSTGVQWTASGTLITSSDPDAGGIIDRNLVSGKWFVIFNTDLTDDRVYDTPGDAAIAFLDALDKHRRMNTLLSAFVL